MLMYTNVHYRLNLTMLCNLVIRGVLYNMNRSKIKSPYSINLNWIHSIHHMSIRSHNLMVILIKLEHYINTKQ